MQRACLRYRVIYYDVCLSIYITNSCKVCSRRGPSIKYVTLEGVGSEKV